MIFEKEDSFAKTLLQSDKMKIPTRKPYLVVYTKFDDVDPINGQDFIIQKVVWAFNEAGVRRQVLIDEDHMDRQELLEFESIKRFSV